MLELSLCFPTILKAPQHAQFGLFSSIAFGATCHFALLVLVRRETSYLSLSVQFRITRVARIWPRRS